MELNWKDDGCDSSQCFDGNLMIGLIEYRTGGYLLPWAAFQFTGVTSKVENFGSRLEAAKAVETAWTASRAQ